MEKKILVPNIINMEKKTEFLRFFNIREPIHTDLMKNVNNWLHYF